MDPCPFRGFDDHDDDEDVEWLEFPEKIKSPGIPVPPPPPPLVFPERAQPAEELSDKVRVEREKEVKKRVEQQLEDIVKRPDPTLDPIRKGERVEPLGRLRLQQDRDLPRYKRPDRFRNQQNRDLPNPERPKRYRNQDQPEVRTKAEQGAMKAVVEGTEYANKLTPHFPRAPVDPLQGPGLSRRAEVAEIAVTDTLSDMEMIDARRSQPRRARTGPRPADLGRKRFNTPPRPAGAGGASRGYFFSMTQRIRQLMGY